MTTDSIYIIGHSHKVCEDYALNGSIKNGGKCKFLNSEKLDLQYAIVCDGCSSSDNTDVGARLISIACKHTINYPGWKNRFDEDEVGIPIITEANITRQMLHLNYQSLDATLLVARIHDNFLQVVGFGDGVIIYGYNDGSIIASSLDYDNEMPYYLSYKLNKERDKEYQKINSKGVKNTIYTLTSDNIKVKSIYTGYRYFYNCIQLTNLKFVLVCSDGVRSFHRSDVGCVDLEYVIKELTSFKLVNGPFIQRRVKKMIKTFAKNGFKAYDDISIAGIYIGE